MNEKLRKRLLGLCIFNLVAIGTSSLLKISQTTDFYRMNLFAILGMLWILCAIYLFEKGFIQELNKTNNKNE